MAAQEINSATLYLLEAYRRELRATGPANERRQRSPPRAPPANSRIKLACRLPVSDLRDSLSQILWAELRLQERESTVCTSWTEHGGTIENVPQFSLEVLEISKVKNLAAYVLTPAQ